MSKPEKPVPEKRSALRIPTPVDIVLKCPDKLGKTFIEKTQTVDISRTGAKTVTEHDVSNGARLQMAVPDRKRTSWATVARVGNKTGKRQEIGIALDETSDFWGVSLPDDMQAANAARTAAERAGPGPKASTAAAEASSSLALVQELLSSAELKQAALSATPEAAAEAAEQLAGMLQDRVRHAIEQSLDEALRRLNEQANEIMKNMQELIAQETGSRLRQCVEAAVRQVEAAAKDVTKRSQPVWEQTIQASAASAQDQLKARLAEHETQLAASAAKLRRELVRKLAEAVGEE